MCRGSGSVADLALMPATGSGSVADLALMPATGSGSVADLALMPATGSGSVADLALIPATGSGTRLRNLNLQSYKTPATVSLYSLFHFHFQKWCLARL